MLSLGRQANTFNSHGAYGLLNFENCQFGWSTHFVKITSIRQKTKRPADASLPVYHNTETQFETGIFPILACQIFGAVSCTELPVTSTATLTGMSSTTFS